jgi:hypothetical protein
MSHAFTFAASDQRLALAPGHHHDSADVLGLHLALQVEDIEGTTHRQMVLTIQNRTSDFLAYRVDTRPSQGTRPCFEKADYAHDAVALAPGEKARRSECMYRSGWRLFVDRVETVVVPRLSYYYLSAVPPAALGLALLPSRGHQPAGGRSMCQIFHPAELERAIRSGDTTWRDLVDFYGRHSCQTFVFPAGYKAFQHDGERPLPAVTVRP